MAISFLLFGTYLIAAGLGCWLGRVSRDREVRALTLDRDYHEVTARSWRDRADILGNQAVQQNARGDVYLKRALEAEARISKPKRPAPAKTAKKR